MDLKKFNNLKTFDLIQFISRLVILVATIFIFVWSASLQNINANDLSSLKKIGELTTYHNLFVAAFVINVGFFAYSAYIRSKLGKSFKSMQNFIALAANIAYLIVYFQMKPLVKLAKLFSQFTSGSLFNGSSALQDIVSGGSEILAELSKSGSGKDYGNTLGIFLLIAFILMAISTVLLYLKLFKGKTNKEIEGSMSAFQSELKKKTVEIKNKSIEAGKSLKNSFDNISDTKNYQDYDDEPIPTDHTATSDNATVEVADRLAETIDSEEKDQ